MTTPAPKAKAYNLNVTPLTEADTTPTASGKAKIRFRGTFEQGGKTIERTVVAQGVAAELIAGMITPGTAVGLRCVYSRAPGEDGKKGGEYLSVVALPRKKAA